MQTYRTEEWAQWGKERVRQTEKAALKHTSPYVK